MIALLPLLALAGELHVVRAGETVEALAAERGDPALAAVIRQQNGLATGDQPAIGQVLRLPDDPDGVDQPAQLLALVGSGTVRPPGGAPAAVGVGAFLPPGAELCTGPESYATVRLAALPGCDDEDDVTLLPETCLRVDGVHGRADARTSLVSVRRGAVRLGDTATPGRVAVQTPSGITAGERGGFRVAVEDGAMRTEAVTASVAVLAQGMETTVAVGTGVRTPTGGTPGDPVTLLPGQDLVRPEPDARLDVPDFAWLPAPRALGYRVELATDPDFTRLVRRAEVGAAAWRPAQLFLPYLSGALYWRAVPFDRLGFEGVPSQARRLRFPRGVEAASAP
jgi:hypothetical protein